MIGYVVGADHAGGKRQAPAKFCRRCALSVRRIKKENILKANVSVQFHMRFVTEKHQELVQALDSLIKGLVSEDLNNKIALSKIALQKSTDLRSAVSKQDCPSWLPGLIDGLNHFLGGTWKQEHLIDHLINVIVNIKAHSWVFESQSDTPFDFDSIFEHYKSESRLNELFDEIIKILEEIEASGEIDSLSMINALDKVICTIKKNKNGSYFSVNGAWSFLVSFLQNYMWAELYNIPVLGTALEALEKTINETNEEMSKVHNQVKKDMSNAVEAEVKALRNKTNFNFIGYEKQNVNLRETTTLPPPSPLDQQTAVQIEN